MLWIVILTKISCIFLTLWTANNAFQNIKVSLAIKNEELSAYARLMAIANVYTIAFLVSMLMQKPYRGPLFALSLVGAVLSITYAYYIIKKW